MFNKFFLILIYLIIFICNVFGFNSYPIILLHGFLGWGRDEMGEYYYWGGKADLEAILRDAGHEVYTVSVGPISPNFDRAIEAFYQIKGGQVDYGNEKSDSLGIIQRPSMKNFKGLYPHWDADHPIHIISHSQGGQTARMLEILLKTTINGETSPLLSQIYINWIKSITTISTPHNGTTLVPIMTDIFPFVLNLAPWLGGIEIDNINSIYNFDLEHWGLERRAHESLREYFRRIGDSTLSSPQNLCSWDLSPQGATEFNKGYSTDPDVYYFSFPTYSTKYKKNSHLHKPDSKMSFHLWSTSMLMGRYSKVIDNTWYENDGICNTVSMTHPFGSPVSIFDGNPQKGIWQIVDRLHMDHQAVIGHLVTKEELEDIIVLYKEHAMLLSLLK